MTIFYNIKLKNYTLINLQLYLKTYGDMNAFIDLIK